MDKKLNLLLADLVVEYHKLQNFHWYVKGKSFFTLHSKLEELYTGINKSVDEVAETILIIGGKPLGSLKEFLAHSKIKEEEDKLLCGEYILKEVASDFEYLLNSLKEIKIEADEKNEFLVSTLVDDLAKDLAKVLWMLKQSYEEAENCSI